MTKRHRIEAWRVGAPVLSLFSVVDRGLVPGVQTITRAELCALVQALRFARVSGHADVHIFTDSQVALSEVRRVVAGGSPHFPEFAEAIREAWSLAVTLRKIKAYRDLDSLQGQELWDALGNASADAAAKAAVRADMQLVSTMVDQVAEWVTRQRDALLLYYRFVLAISGEDNRLRTQAGQRAQSLEPVLDTEVPTETTRQWEEWKALGRDHSIRWGVPPFQRDWLLCQEWPPWFTVPVWEWLRKLRWANAAQGTLTTGITYTELLVHFVCSTGQCPPVRTQAVDGPKYMDASTGGMLVHNTPLREWTLALVTCCRCLERVSGQRLLPHKRRKVYSLRLVGIPQPRSGLQQRPCTDVVPDMAELLRQVLMGHSVGPLVSYCISYTGPIFVPPRDLSNAWNESSSQTRHDMGRWLRRIRG